MGSAAIWHFSSLATRMQVFLGGTFHVSIGTKAHFVCCAKKNLANLHIFLGSNLHIYLHIAALATLEERVEVEEEEEEKFP